jgi:hypothetical protein
MKKMGFTIGLVMVATLVATVSDANAQGHHRLRRTGTPIYSGTDANGMTMTDFQGRNLPPKPLLMGLHNHYSPAPVYTYSKRGILAGRTNTWNQNEAATRPWHDGYMNWKWGEPTALVVPPTAAYETSYGWGVGQVRSTPIHAQFGRGGAGTVGGSDSYQQTPYLPSHTNQFGIYPVRAPW